MSAWDLLSPAQAAATRAIVDAESAFRDHVVISLSGAHAYGFPSPDSDVDVKSVHRDPTASFLGLSRTSSPAERLEWVGGVEVDYSSNELGGALAGVLNGNGNYIERFCSGWTLAASPALPELAALVRTNLSRRLHRHYRGFATSQRLQWDETRRAKKALYVLRTTLTGRHALLTGEIVTDVTQLLDEAGFAEARTLVAIKAQGEKAAMDVDALPHWNRVLDRAFTSLDDALARSPLPAEPAAPDALEAWLIRFRLAHT